MTIGLAILLALSTILPQPSVDAPCRASTLRIATDNAPVGNGPATSIVNIWTFGKNKSMADAWLYKNRVGQYFLQFNRAADPRQYLGAPLSNKLLKWPESSAGNFPLVKINVDQLVELENYLLIRGVSRSACFARDYRM